MAGRRMFFMQIKPKGIEAKVVERKKRQLLKGLTVPKEGLPGSLALTHSRCRSKGCHCATDEKGHPSWSLTYMSEGKKHVEKIPEEWVDYVRARVAEGKQFRETVNRVFSANAELLVLLRKQGR